MTIPQKVTDISDTDQLLRYAAAGQLAHLLQERKFLNNGLVGQGAGFGRLRRVLVKSSPGRLETGSALSS